MMFLWSYGLIFIAAFFNACMDAWENENYFESIFKHWDQKFWYKRESWKYAHKLFGYHFDGWHLAKTSMIICVAGAIYTEQFSNQIWHTGNVFIDVAIDIVIMGVIWNLGFRLFYHILFGIK